MARSLEDIVEQQLVSLAGTLFYLNKVERTLEGKPLVPRHMEGIMTSVTSELAQLNDQCYRSKDSVHRVAEPILLQWLTHKGWSIGGPVTARVDQKGTVTAVTGRLHSVNVCERLVESWRAVELVLVPVSLTAPPTKLGTPAAKVGDLDEDAYTVRRILRDAVVREDAGTELAAIRVRVPVQERIQKKVARHFLGATVTYGS